MRFKVTFFLLISICLSSPADALRLYTHDKYEAARNRAVQEARNGNLESALKSLKRLLKLEPGNQGALNDYITVLVWNEEYRKALSQLPKIKIEKAPEYVLRSLVNAASREKEQAIIDRLIDAYMQRYDFVPEDAPKHISGKSMHETAEVAANLGRYEISRSIMKQLYDQKPDNQTIIGDYIATLSKTGDHTKALELAESMDLEHAREYVISALIGSADHMKNQALEDKLTAIYIRRFEPDKEVVKKDETEDQIETVPDTPPVADTLKAETSAPEEPEAVTAKKERKEPKPIKPSPPDKSVIEKQHINQADRLLDENKLDQARHILMPMYLEGHRSIEFLKVTARLLAREGEHAKAASLYKEVLELSPDDEESKKEMIQQLSYAGASHLALETASEYQITLDSTASNKIRLDTEAQMIRWSQYKLPSGISESEYLDSVIEIMEGRLATLTGNEDRESLRRLNSDYLVALRLRDKMAKVISHYEDLMSQGADLHAYTLTAVADAYLSEHQPETAVELYQISLQENPGSFELKRSLFYAYSDAGQYDAALKLGSKLAEQTPLWRKDHSGEVVKNNEEKMSADILLANAYAFRDDLAEAQKRLESLRNKAPYNAEARSNLSTIYRWRGWPRKAYQEAAIARTIDLDSLYIGISNARALIDLHDYESADNLIHQLNEAADENKQLEELNEDWALHKMRELYFRFETGDSDPKSSSVNKSNHGSSDLTYETYLYDRPYQYYFRPYLHQYYADAEFTEGKGRYERIGFGLEYKKKAHLIKTEVSQSYKGQSDAGLSISGEYDFNDHLSLNYGFNSFSTNVPIRAYFHNIEGKEYKLGVSYRLHEITDISGSFEYLDFTDKNERKAGSLALSHRVINQPQYKMTLRPSLYFSSNSKTDGPYYSPEEDASINLNLINEWLSYRRHNLAFRQRLEVNIGVYDQEGYSDNATGGLVYQHDWQSGKRLNLNYGIKWAKNYYDGDREDRTAVFAALNWLF